MVRRALLGALVLLGTIAPALGAQVPLGFVTSPARDTLVANWTDQPDANERAYCVDQDSMPQDWGPEYRVVYVTRIHRITPTATPMSIAVDTLCHGRPVLHTHEAYCRVGPWGPEPSTCSVAVPEAYQCQPSFADLVLLTVGGEDYDIIQCGPRQFVFFWRATLLGGTPHDSSPNRERAREAVSRVRRP